MSIPRPVICLITHGIGSQDPNFSEPLRKGIQRRLRKLIRKKTKQDPQTWSGVTPEQTVEFRSLYWADVASNEQDELYRTVYPHLFEAGPLRKTLGFFRFDPARRLSITLVGDIFSYLGKFQEEIKRTVFRGFQDVFQARIESNSPFSLILVGHSLGAVVMHDIIRGFVGYRYAGLQDLPGRTSVFTMGSPIGLFSLVSDTLDPGAFRKWVNILHFRDPIAVPLNPLFSSVEDVALRSRTLNPHSVYWKRSKVHKLIAEEVLNHIENKIQLDPAKLRVPKEVPSEIFRPFHGPALTAGFSDYQLDFNKIPWEELIQVATEIDICNVYAHTWYRTHAQYFVKAFGNPAVRVRICMLSPASPAIPGFCHQFSRMARDTLENYILRSCEEVLHAFTEAKRRPGKLGHLQIYLSNEIINHSFYTFDHVIYFSPRPISSPKHAATPIPVMVFRETQQAGDFSSWIMRDFKALLETPRDVIPYFDSQGCQVEEKEE